METKHQDEQAASSPFPGFHNVLMTPPVCSPLLSVPRSWGGLLSSFTPLVLFTSPPLLFIPSSLPGSAGKGTMKSPLYRGTEATGDIFLGRNEWSFQCAPSCLPNAAPTCQQVGNIHLGILCVRTPEAWAGGQGKSISLEEITVSVLISFYQINVIFFGKYFPH